MRIHVALGVGVLLALGACSSSLPSEDVLPKTSTHTAAAAMTPTPTPSPTPTTTAPAQGALAGYTISVDAGHNSGNYHAPDQVNALVPDGRGGMKACDTTGTSTNDGYRESAFTWDVALRVRAGLEANDATVVMPRTDDNSVGPCVDYRGNFPAANGADVAISIHANGSENPATRGFFILLADPPLAGPTIAQHSRDLADAIIVEMQAAGFPISPYGAITPRDDIAGLNFNKVPAVLVELGEMRNREDAELMKSEAGRQRYADALVASLLRWADTHQPAQ
ncbi:MAG: N-acetylmuramoyl-L-alanine amidase [Bowdeniella nasicola]|nr:N-acetylmuramoyl-L-alanine amidase [Bowdeniella nasicola]